MRASGISLLSLISPILLLSLVLCGLSALVNMEIAPRCRVAYKNLLGNVNFELSKVIIPEDTFIKEFRGYIFYAKKNRNGNLEDVMVFQLADEHHEETVCRASRGVIEQDPANKKLLLKLFDAKSLCSRAGDIYPDVGDFAVEVDLNPSNKDQTLKISDMTHRQLLAELRELEKDIKMPISVTNLSRLSHDERLRQQQELRLQLKREWTTPVRVQIHQQIAFSFACFGFTLVGIPLGIRLHRRETNIGIAMALVFVAIYYSFIMLGQSLDTRPEWSPQLIVWVPDFLFQAVGAVLLWRANRGI